MTPIEFQIIIIIKLKEEMNSIKYLEINRHQITQVYLFPQNWIDSGQD